jgi:protein AbiQ
MKSLRLVKISDKYINYLNGVDSKVQYNKHAKRPYVGIVFSFAGIEYFVPMESPKPNHANIKPGKHILRIKNGEYGLLGFNNMIPVHRDALIEFDINKEKNVKYRNLLQHQVNYCNRMKADILNHAQMTYFDVVSKKNKFLVSISCDFKKLERACKNYDKNYVPSKYRKDN